MNTYLVIFIDGTSITRFAEDEAELRAAITEEFPGRAIESIKNVD